MLSPCEDRPAVNLQTYAAHLLPRIIGYGLCRLGLLPAIGPINLTFSVTNMCQSRCRTCSVWRLYKDDRAGLSEELSIGDIEAIFAGIGHVYFFNISGGEPFLRPDLPQIVAAACKYLTPRVIHAPTNALTPEIIESRVEEILDVIKAAGRMTYLTIKPSFDGVGPVHDAIRGVEGNFDKLLDTLTRLKKLQAEHPNLEIGLGTIISRFNLDYVRETARFAGELGVDSYISEVAEERSELFNIGEPITPTADEYEAAIKTFNSELPAVGRPDDSVSAMALAFRQIYYRLTVQILREGRQVLPCYAGLANVHLSPYGDVWPCCVLGYEKSMGNLKDHAYDFYRIWRSEEAGKIRRFIAEGRCYCPLANQAYSNILCSPTAMLDLLRQRRLAKTTRR